MKFVFEFLRDRSLSSSQDASLYTLQNGLLSDMLISMRIHRVRCEILVLNLFIS